MRMPGVAKAVGLAAAIAVLIAVGIALEGGQSPTAVWEGDWLGRAHAMLLHYAARDAEQIEEESAHLALPDLDPDSRIDAYGLRANLYLRTGQWGLAERDLSAARQLRGSDKQKQAMLWMMQGTVDVMKRRDQAVIVDFTKAIDVAPEDREVRWPAHFCRAAAKRRLKDFAGSLSDLDAAVTDVTDMRGVIEQFESSMRGKLRGEIERNFIRVSRQLRGSVFRARARTWRAEGRYDDALRDDDEAVSLMPRDPGLLAERAQTQFLRGDWRAGFADLLAATSLSFAGRPLRSDRTVTCGP
jgi:tetratricopeptide (TPR) repeat protein